MEEDIEFYVDQWAAQGYLNQLRFTVGPYYESLNLQPKNYLGADGFQLYGQMPSAPEPKPITLKVLRMHNSKICQRKTNLATPLPVWLHLARMIRSETVPASADNLTFLANFLKCRAQVDFAAQAIWLLDGVEETENEYIINMVIEHLLPVSNYLDYSDSGKDSKSKQIVTIKEVLDQEDFDDRHLRDFLTKWDIRGREGMINHQRFLPLNMVRKG